MLALPRRDPTAREVRQRHERRITFYSTGHTYLGNPVIWHQVAVKNLPFAVMVMSYCKYWPPEGDNTSRTQRDQVPWEGACHTRPVLIVI